MPVQQTYDWVINICYDPLWEAPYCDMNAEIPWRYIADIYGIKDFVYEDTCQSQVIDYYSLIEQFVQQKQSFCKYQDADYDRVKFFDVKLHREYSSIEALKHFCIVKWEGDMLNRYEPNRRMSREEFIKILVKVMLMDYDFEVLPEWTTYDLDIPYKDVANDRWSVQYIMVAHELWLLDPLMKHEMVKSFFKPSKSITNKEIIEVLRALPDGHQLSQETMYQILWWDKYPSRWSISSLIVKKFLSSFRSYFYLQWENEEYYYGLLDELRGKSFQKQYEVILKQTKKLEWYEQEHGSAEVSGLYPFWIKSYLKTVANMSTQNNQQEQEDLSESESTVE